MSFSKISQIVLNYILKTMAKPFVIFADYFDHSILGYDEAIANLNKIHNNANGSCIKPKIVNNNTYDLDIIVPCFNVERYISDCVHSILNQVTNYSFRVILIDDGSFDKTASILDDYADISNVMVIHQKNAGLSEARNTGLRHIDSKYVMFVDSDDMIEAGAIDMLLKCAMTNHVDVVTANYTTVDSSGQIIAEDIGCKNFGLINPIESVPGYAWGKIYNSNIFNCVGFPTGYWFEDTLLKKIIFCTDIKCFNLVQSVYKYRQNNQSITHLARNNIRSIESLYVYLKLYEDSRALNLKFDQDDYNYLLTHIILTARRTRFLNLKIQKLVFYTWCGFFAKHFKTFRTNKPKLAVVERCLHNFKFWEYILSCNFYI